MPKKRTLLIKKPQAKKRQYTPKFPVIGIGASAGGLKAIEEFLDNLSADSGMAFIIMLHRQQSHESILTELLTKHTTLQVLEAIDGLKIMPNNIYLSPAGYNINVVNGLFHFTNHTEDTNPPLPIDYFLRSLATDLKDYAGAIILSGTGKDGSGGAEALKAIGGVVLAQDPKSAEYDGMPQSAIQANLVDYILLPAQMPRKLIAYFDNHKQTMIISPALIANLDKIFALIRQNIGSDFSLYKTSTMCRRIERRMNINNIQDPEKYVEYLEANPHEIDMLFKELLIGVTSFFRDSGAFKILSEKLLPKMLESKPDDYVFRVWVPACSTGEEAYSIAIILREYMRHENKNFNIQIFATDLDSRAIEAARNGHYSANHMVGVPALYIKRYFTKEDNQYCINRDIREMVIFAKQNVLQDPPFTRMDMISCRNLLIYLDSQLQKQLIPLFHYALKPNGLLLLGSSESIGAFNNLFNPADNRWKLFEKKENTTLNRGIIGFPTMNKKNDSKNAGKSETYKNFTGTDITSKAETLLMQNCVPPSVIVNEEGQVFYVHGKTGIWLEPATGQYKSNQSILDMARDGLRSELALIIRKASGKAKKIVQKNIHFNGEKGVHFVDITASKITTPESLGGLLIITFTPSHETEMASSKKSKSKAGLSNNTDRLEAMEMELDLTKRNLRSSIEELETSNEEFQAANEELQSTNEELETSKEEMQSLNEELQTVNAELEEKVSELSHANDDMKNLLNNTGIATIFVDNDLNIRRFTVQAQKIINLIDRDVGRPIRDIVSNLNYDSMVSDAADVLRTLTLKEIEVTAKDGKWYLVRILPYRTEDNIIDGLVITFVNISELKKTTQQLKKSEEHLLSLIRDAALCIFELDVHGIILSANEDAMHMFHKGKNGNVTGKSFLEVVHKKDRKKLEDIIKNNWKSESLEFTILNSDSSKCYSVKFVPLNSSAGKIEKIMAISQDITERKAAEGEIEQQPK